MRHSGSPSACRALRARVRRQRGRQANSDASCTDAQGSDRRPQRRRYIQVMKKVLELLVFFLHPVAVVLIWIDLATRRNIAGGAKLAWALFSLIPVVPFLYVLTGGDLWLGPACRAGADDLAQAALLRGYEMSAPFGTI